MPPVPTVLPALTALDGDIGNIETVVGNFVAGEKTIIVNCPDAEARRLAAASTSREA